MACWQTKLTSELFTVIQDFEDLNTLIVRKAMEKSTQFLDVGIVAEDTDLNILFNFIAPNLNKHLSHSHWKGPLFQCIISPNATEMLEQNTRSLSLSLHRH